LRVFFGGGFFFDVEDEALLLGVFLNGQRPIIAVVLGLGRQVGLVFERLKWARCSLLRMAMPFEGRKDVVSINGLHAIDGSTKFPKRRTGQRPRPLKAAQKRKRPRAVQAIEVDKEVKRSHH
jgi:hypothetical protein